MTSPLISKLNAVRRRHASVALTVAVVATVGLAVLCLAGGMLLDRWLDLPYAARAVLLAVDGLGLLAVLVWRGLLPVVRRPDVEQAAVWVERAVPAFASRLISSVQFLQPAGVAAGESAAMVRALVRQTEATAADVDFAAVVPTRTLVRVSWAGLAIVIAAAVAFLCGGRTSVALAERALLVPGVPFPHRTLVTVTSGDRVVARGDPVTLSATATGDVPAGGAVRVRRASGGSSDLPVASVGRTFRLAVDNVQDPFAYRFAVGDDESAEYHVRTADRPAVLGVRCRVTPPAYTGLAPADRSPWDLSLLAGSSVGLTVTANVPCGGTVRFVGVKQDVPLPGEATVLTSADVPVPAGATGFTVDLVSADGLRSRDPVVYRIDTVADRPPAVRLTAPAADVTVTPVARPTVVVWADDDYGVVRTSLRYRITKAGQATAIDDDPNGLTGTYGTVARVDPTIDLSWAATPPPAGAGEPCPVRWVGSIRPAVSDDYRFSAQVTGGCRFTIDGRVLISRPGQGEEGPVHLQAGRLYPVELTATVTAGGEARLSWRGRRVPSQVVPHACLYRRTDPYVPPADADGLVGYWPMDDAATGFVHDAAGSADGTVFDASAAADGKVGGAIAFRFPKDVRSPNQHADAAESPVMSYRPDESYTLAAWVKLDGGRGRPQYAVGRGRYGGAFYGLGVDARWRWRAGAGGGDLTGTDVTGGWHHLAVVQDAPAGRRTLYVDGVAAVVGRLVAADGPGPMTFGDLTGSGQAFDGDVDDVRLYARALPADQVRAMATDPRPAHVPTPAEVGGVPGGGAATADLPGPAGPHVRRKLAWDLAALPSPPAVGDTIDLWAEATDGNTVSGPGVGVSDHRHLRVVTSAQKRQELMGRLGDYLGRVKSVAEDQKDLTAEVGTMVGATTRPDVGK